MKAPSSNTLLQRYLRHGIMPQLAAFHTVVRLGSVTRAAEEMCVAQPTLSGYLRKLSDTLGIRYLKCVANAWSPQTRRAC